MSAPAITMDVRRIGEQVAVVDIKGVVTAGADLGTVVLDFAAVDYINSTGIALIVSVLARARAERRKVVACGLSAHYREIFDITRLSDFIELFPDLDRAVSQLTGPAALNAAR